MTWGSLEASRGPAQSRNVPSVTDSLKRSRSRQHVVWEKRGAFCSGPPGAGGVGEAAARAASAEEALGVGSRDVPVEPPVSPEPRVSRATTASRATAPSAIASRGPREDGLLTGEAPERGESSGVME